MTNTDKILEAQYKLANRCLKCGKELTCITDHIIVNQKEIPLRKRPEIKLVTIEFCNNCDARPIDHL